MYHNGIFIPLGIIRRVYGPDSVYLSDLFLFTFLFPAFFFNTYQFFFDTSKRDPKFTFNWGILRNPILVATLVSMTLKLTGASAFVPMVVIKIASVVSEMALPLIILIIGGSIYLDFQKKEKIRFGEVALFVVVKNIIFPAIVLFMLFMVRPSFNVALILVLSAAAPPITAFPIVTEKAGGNRGIANQMITASFIASLGLLPAAMWLLNRIYSS
jgi:predicted permease